MSYVKRRLNENPQKTSVFLRFFRLFIVYAFAAFLCKFCILSDKNTMFCHLILGYVLEYVLGSPNPPKQGLGQPCAPQNTIETHQDLAKMRQIGLEMPAQTLLNAPKTHPRCKTGALSLPRTLQTAPTPLQGTPQGLPNPSKAFPEAPKPFKKPYQNTF